MSTVSILSRKNELGAVASSTSTGRKRSKLSFHDRDEIRDYEKESAIQDDRSGIA